MWGLEEWWSWENGGRVVMRIVVREGIYVGRGVITCKFGEILGDDGGRGGELTNSPKRASAGRSVGAGSRCRSIPSNTRMKRSLLSRRTWSWATKAARFSHLPSISKCVDPSPRLLKVSRTAEMVCSRRCRVVMHSLELTMA